MGEPDFDDFIRQQKERLAKERQTLSDGNNNRQDSYVEGRRKWQRDEDHAEGLNYVTPYAAEQAADVDDQPRSRQVPQQRFSSSSGAVGQDVQGPTGRGPTTVGPAAGDSSLFSGLGEYEKKRRALNEERKKEYNDRLSEKKYENPRPPAADFDGRVPPPPGGGSGSSAEPYEATLPGLRDRLSAEQAKVRQRNAEYNELLRTKLKPSAAAAAASTAPPEDSSSESGTAYLATLPGIRDRLSAEQEKVRQRNAEYNEFLQQQQHHRPGPGRRERDASSRAGTEREPSLLTQDDLVQGRPPLPGLPSRNKGWGTPTYDEILEAKRRDELAYRRHDDPETKLGMPLAGKAYARNAGSENDISRDYPDSGRLARGGDQRKVSFADNVTGIPAGGGSHDRLASQRRRSDPSNENGKLDAPFSQDPAVRPGNRYNSTLLIGREERTSATRKKKDVYRLELMAQMEEAAQARKYEKQNELPVNATGLVDPIRALPGAASRTPPPHPAGSGPQYPSGQSYQPSVLDATRPPLTTGATVREDPYSSDNFARQPTRNDLGILERGFGGLFDSRLLQQPPLDAGYSRLSSNPYGSPIVLPPAPPVVPLPTFVPGAIAPAFGQYGGGLPAAPAAAAYPGIYPQALPQPLYGSAPQQAIAYAQPLPNGGSQQQPGVPPQYAGLATPAPARQQQQQASTASKQQPPAVGLFSIGEERQKPAKTDYSAELQRQIEERKLAKQKEKEEQQRYDQKLEAEIAAYNPYGRGGGGAPMKDTEGNTVADRRTLKKVIAEGLTPRGDVISVPSVAAVASKPPPAAAASSAFVDNGQANGSSLASDGSAPDANAQNFARGGNGIFGEPKSDVQKTAADKYKDELRLQIEEKKRKQEEERRRAREEEEREAARLEEERVRIQREFDLEQQRTRDKEEEARRKNEDLIKQADEKRKETEKKALEREESRQKAEQERQLRDQQQQQQREQPIGRGGDAVATAAAAPVAAAPEAPISLALPKLKKTVETALFKPVLPSPRANTAVGSVAIAGQESAPTTRLKSAEVLSQLAHMRRQLQQERLRVENALEKQKADIASFGSNDDIRAGGGVDAFELARRRHGAPAASRRPLQPKNSSPAPSLHLADDVDRLGTVPESPERSSSSHLDSTSSFVLPVKPQSSNSLLDGETAFIDSRRGVGLSYPDDFDELRIHDAADGKRPDHRGSTPASARSIDPEKITRRNQDRLKKLKQIAGDDMSVADPDDIIDRFMAQHHKPRPASGQTLEDESWLKAGSR